MSITEVSPTDGAARVAAGAILLDVREPDEWSAGHAPGATWIPLGALAARVAELPADQPVVCICRAGARSLKAAEHLVAGGRDAVNLTGGMQAWAAAGLEVVSESGGPGQVI